VNDSSTPSTPPAGGGPWRLFVLLRSDPSDPIWVTCTVEPFCVKGANVDQDGNVCDDFSDVSAWIAGTLGVTGVSLAKPPDPLVWRIDPGERRP
jgi:hypothetical protein